MAIGPELFVAGAFAAGYAYWRFSFRQLRDAARLERTGHLDDARTLLNEFLINRNPLTSRAGSKARCRLQLARLERNAGYYDAAIGEAQTLIDGNPSPGLVIAGIQVQADVLSWTGDLEGALQRVEKARALAESSREVSFLDELDGLKVRIWIWQGELSRARALAESLVDKGGPSAFHAHLRMAELERVAGNFEASVEWCKKLLDLVGSDPSAKAPNPGAAGQAAPPALWATLARYHAARSSWLAGDITRAREWMDSPDEVPALPRSDAVGWTGLRAVLEDKAGDASAARRSAREFYEASARAPGGYGARAWEPYYRARIAAHRERWKEAAAGVAAAMRNYPPGDAIAEMFYFLGLYQQEAGDPAAPEAFASGARQPATLHFARLCREKGQRQENGSRIQSSDVDAFEPGTPRANGHEKGEDVKRAGPVIARKPRSSRQ